MERSCRLHSLPMLPLVNTARGRESLSRLTMMQFQHVLTQAVPSSAGLDPRGEQVVWQASGWAARIIQHEMDHLQGCLFIDKMDSKTFTNIHWMEVND